MCHPESIRFAQDKFHEGSRFLAQGKLREGSHEFLRFAQDMLRLTPQNDIVTQPLRGEGGGEGCFGHWELGFWIYLEIVICSLEFETGG